MTHPDLDLVRRVLGDRCGPGVREHYTVVPSAASPRLLVPRGDRRVSASAVRQAIVATSGRARVRQQALAAIFTAGLGDLVFRDTVTVDATAPLSAHLSDALGREVRVSMRFGPPRANRKPVLQLLDPSGECLAFVKVGVNDITRDLVRVETEILRGLEGRDLGPRSGSRACCTPAPGTTTPSCSWSRRCRSGCRPPRRRPRRPRPGSPR